MLETVTARPHDLARDQPPTRLMNHNSYTTGPIANSRPKPLPASRVRLVWLLIGGLWFAIYFASLFSPPLLDDADATHAQAAQSMIQSGDWVTLHVNGVRYLEKPPLPYWIAALSLRLFANQSADAGTFATFAIHLPLALTVLALAILGFVWSRRAFGERAALYTAVFLLTSTGAFLFTRIFIPDALLSLLLALSLYCMLRALEPTTNAGAPRLDSETWVRRMPSIYAYLMWTALALAILAKGLVALVFFFGTAAIFLPLAGELRHWRRLRPFTGILLLLAIAAPWHILAGLQNPTQGRIAGIQFTHWLLPSTWIIPQPTPGNVHGWFWFYFLNEHLLRYLNLRVPRDYDTVPLWIFWLLLFVWLMPWSAWLCCAHGEWLRVARNLRSRTLLPADRTQLLLVLWAATVMLFFTFSTRQEYYSLPALPALALLIAARLDHEISPAATAARRTGRRISLLILIVAIPASLAALYFLVFSRTPTPGTDLSTLLQQNPSDYALSLGHFLDLDRQCLGLFRPALFLTAIALAPGALANFHFRRRNRPAAGNAALFAMMLVMMLAAHSAFRTFNTVLGSEPLAAAIAAQHPAAQDLIAIHGEYESGSTLAFYLRRDDLHILDGRSSNLWYGSFFPDAPAVFETHASLAAKWASPQRIFMWNDPSDTTRPLPALSPVYVIARSGGKEILSNQPAR